MVAEFRDFAHANVTENPGTRVPKLARKPILRRSEATVRPRKAKKIGSADPGIRARAPVPAGPAGNWRETAPDWRTIPRFGGKSSTQKINQAVND
jgi:hypothetical protein